MTDQQYTFDLIQQPWLPCLDLNGKPLEYDANLRDVFANAPEISAIQGETPLVTISLYRLLIAILLAALRHANQAPRRVEEWATLWHKKVFDMDLCNGYFNAHKDRFDLFHPKYPFYQNLDAQGKKDEKGNSFSKRMPDMIHEIAWGNNPTLFDHHFESAGFKLSSAQATRRLVAIQAFGLGGLSGFSKKNFRIAPLVKDVVLLAQGNNLFETFMLNLPLITKKEKNDLPSWAVDNRPDWEDSRSADDEKGYLPREVLDYLTWQNRLVWLKPENTVTQMRMSRGYSLKMDRVEEVRFEPMKSYYRREKKDGTEYFVPIIWDERQALWRDSATLLNVHVERGDRPPHAFKLISDALTLSDSPLEATHRYRFSAFGLVPNKSGGSAEFYRQETFPLPLEYLRSEKAVEKLKDNLKEAERVGRKLKGACDYIKKQLYPSDGNDRARQVFADGVLRRYWSQLETMFSSMMIRTAQDDMTRDDETLRWRNEINTAVHVAFEEAIIGLGMSARSYRLYVRGVEKIWGNPIKRKKQKPIQNGGDDMPQDGQSVVQAKRFVAYLRKLKQSDRGAGAMAELRHALNHDIPLDAQPIVKYVARWLNSQGIGSNQPWLIQPLCLIAALYALHSENVEEGNMGTHMAQLCSGSNKMNVESVERRFGRLLETPLDNLQDYLSQVIRLLRSHEVPVNWARLLVDIRQWNEPTYANEVRRYWAREFWFRVSEKSKQS